MHGEFNKDFIGKFDKILIDVPCLGLGVMKRKPDIKWQRKEEDIKKITKIQFDILQKCSEYLKTGGELVYSTCSILKSENEELVEKWINYANVEKSRNSKKYQIVHVEKILPDEDNDGFFICKIKKLS